MALLFSLFLMNTPPDLPDMGDHEWEWYITTTPVKKDEV